MTLYISCKNKLCKKRTKNIIILLNFDSGKLFPESKIENADFYKLIHIYNFSFCKQYKNNYLVNKYYLLTFV